VTDIALSTSTSLTAVGLTISSDLDFDEWEDIGSVLGKVRDATAFALGDWFVWGDAAFGEIAVQAVEATGRSKTTIMEYVRVARRVPRSRRRSTLSFTHHQLVAARPEEEQERLLEVCEQNRWSVEELRGALHADPALSTRRDHSRPKAEIVALVFEASGAVLRASEQLDERHARVPLDVLSRLANALAEEPPWVAGPDRLVDVPARQPPKPPWA
jgi:hypothetical protein